MVITASISVDLKHCWSESKARPCQNAYMVNAKEYTNDSVNK